MFMYSLRHDIITRRINLELAEKQAKEAVEEAFRDFDNPSQKMKVLQQLNDAYSPQKAMENETNKLINIARVDNEHG